MHFFASRPDLFSVETINLTEEKFRFRVILTPAAFTRYSTSSSLDRQGGSLRDNYLGNHTRRLSGPLSVLAADSEGWGDQRECRVATGHNDRRFGHIDRHHGQQDQEQDDDQLRSGHPGRDGCRGREGDRHIQQHSELCADERVPWDEHLAEESMRGGDSRRRPLAPADGNGLEGSWQSAGS